MGSAPASILSLSVASNSFSFCSFSIQVFHERHVPHTPAEDVSACSAAGSAVEEARTRRREFAKQDEGDEETIDNDDRVSDRSPRGSRGHGLTLAAWERVGRVINGALKAEEETKVHILSQSS